MTRRNRAPRWVVTERDRELLLALFRYRLLSLSQVERLFFPSAQTATRRVRLLAARGFVTVFRVPGIEPRLVALDRQGEEVVAHTCGLTAESIGAAPRRHPKDAFFTRHALAITDVRIALAHACAERADLDLLGFLADHVGRRRPPGGVERYLRSVAADAARPDRSVAHIPDGVFALARNGKAALFFLEVDRGTEPIGNPDRGVGKFLRFYLGLLQDGSYQRHREDFGVSDPFRAFRVLIVTSSSQRLEHIRRASRVLAPDGSSGLRFLWLTTVNDVDASSILEPIWISCDERDTERYAIVPESASRPVGGA